MQYFIHCTVRLFYDLPKSFLPCSIFSSFFDNFPEITLASPLILSMNLDLVGLLDALWLLPLPLEVLDGAAGVDSWNLEPVSIGRKEFCKAAGGVGFGIP